jgi:hypothetical protein
MASDRQIVANRRNARRSTGPRSDAGKRRSSLNSFRHGLAAGITAYPEHAKQIETLARKIVGKTTDVITFECARTIAQTEFDFAQIRRVKVALISRVMAFGEVETPSPFRSPSEIKRFFKAIDHGLIIPIRVETPAMPTTQPERFAEAVRRTLPELVRLERYERRAASRRDRALLAVCNSQDSTINR